MKKYSAERILTPSGFLEGGCIWTEEGRITVVEPCSDPYDAKTIAPGFIDIHAHGGNWYDVMAPDRDSLAEWLLILAKHGVTGVLIGVYTHPIEKMQYCMDFYAEAMKEQSAGKYPGAQMLGVHLEGPFVSKKRLGAMDTSSVQSPSVETFLKICHGHEDIVRLIALAAEEEGAPELIAYCRSRGIRISLGHSNATAEEARYAFAAGVSGITHFFNAAPPMHHRDPGMLMEALLSKGVFAETICDLQHVKAEALLLLHAVKGSERMMIISDSVQTTGLPDGEYQVSDSAPGGYYIIQNGATYVPGGTLAGGGAYSDRAIRNLVSIGIPFQDALCMASQTPAQYLGLDDLGKLIPGAKANFVLLDAENNVCSACIGDSLLT